MSDFVSQSQGLQKRKDACVSLPVLLTLGFGLASDRLGGADAFQTQSLECYLSPNLKSSPPFISLYHRCRGLLVKCEGMPSTRVEERKQRRGAQGKVGPVGIFR